ncbi:hypothetical protein SO802_010424 [Lithocarpus litseifolius]|uniref:Uncharacterized protein n=1 Tax=Lithocarpus litseifolius TaxID=425828 RepID=A0AAW2DEP7_9ROSI
MNKKKPKLNKDSDPSPTAQDSNNNNNDNNNGRGKKIITDTRFAFVHSDPRFQKVPRHKSKVAIDLRFDRMFKEEMENPEEVKLHSAFLADFRAIHQELMDLEAKTAQAEAAAAEMAETLKLELVLPITNMQEAKALSKLHKEYEFKGSVELLHQGLSMAERRELLEVTKAYMLKLGN